jgi:putative NIF3 family GTP cyclohydrolase 1 type 2
MNLDKLVSQIKKDFEVVRFPEDWSFVTEGDKKLEKNATKEFLKDNRGLIFKNSNEAKKIYLACFPSTYVLKQTAKEKDVLLITHHPFDWDGTGTGFKRYSDRDYSLLQKNHISLMFMHVPWDRVRNEKDRVSTAYGTAKKLNMKIDGEFQEYHNAFVSVYGRLHVKNFDDLVEYVKKKLGKKTLNVFKYGSDEVSLVVVVPGGGNEAGMIKEAHELGISTYITGCTNRCKSAYSKDKAKKFLAKAKELNMNVIGASHYLTEKWAMQMSVPYFERFGLPVKFIEDKAQLKKLD